MMNESDSSESFVINACYNFSISQFYYVANSFQFEFKKNNNISFNAIEFAIFF